MYAQIQTLPPQQLRLAGFGSIALLLAVAFTYGIAPTWREYRSAQSSLVLLERNAAGGATLDGQLSQLRGEVTELEHTLSGDASNLPVKQMEAFVIGRLQTISWRNSMALVSVQPRDGLPLQQFSELIFDVELRGDYFDFYTWLQEVGAELGFVVVKRFEMSTFELPDDGSDPRLAVQLTMASYRNRPS